MFDTTAIVPFKASLSQKASPFHCSSRHIDSTTLTARLDIATVHRYAQHPSAIHAFDHLSPPCRPRQHLPTPISPPTKARNRLPSDFVGNGTSYLTLPPHIIMLIILQFKHALPQRRPPHQHPHVLLSDMPLQRTRRLLLRLPQQPIQHRRRDRWCDAGCGS